MNLAHQFAKEILGLSIEEARDRYDGVCIDFAGEFYDWLVHKQQRGGIRLLWLGGLCPASRWRYHCMVQIDDDVHDLWAADPLSLAFVISQLEPAEVDYPLETLYE